MAVHKIKKGLRLPIVGEPEQRIDDAPPPRRVALLAADYVGMKPTMHVHVGDEVRRGQLLFEDKKTPGVRYTAPGGGRVVAVNRGERRALQSVIVELSEEERSGRATSVSFAADVGKHPAELDRDGIRALLVESGLWTALRQRPFSKVADPAAEPAAIFVTAIDTNPLAASVPVVMAGNEEHFERGVQAVAKLTDGPTFVCVGPGTEVPIPGRGDVRLEVFDGPHPAGTVGLHIHRLMPVHRGRVAWYLGYQDAIAIGKLFAGGELDPTRVVALAGPAALRPRLLRTRLGAATGDLVAGEIADGDVRVISGSVLSGRKADGEVLGFLGRHHDQISVLPEGRERELLGWLTPGADKYSTISAYASRLLPGKKFAFTTTTHGSDRAILPIGIHERVFPLDILPTFLLKSLVMHDAEQAEALGVLELDEEDVAVLTFVCPSKHDYGKHLRRVLTIIEKEG